MSKRILFTISDSEHSKAIAIVADREMCVQDFEYFMCTYETVVNAVATVFEGLAEEGGHLDRFDKALTLETLRATTPGSN